MTVNHAGGRTIAHARKFSGFTLIELLVVIAIIALLIAIVLPALAHARRTAYMVREMAHAQQQMVSWNNYAIDNKDAVYTGYIPWEVAHLGDRATTLHWLQPDYFQPGYMVEGNVIKASAYRWMGATNTPPEGLQIVKDLATEFTLKRDGTPSTIHNDYHPPTTLYDTGTNTRAAAFGFHPTLGFNFVYVGGSTTHKAMRGFIPGIGSGGTIGHPDKKKFYVTHLYEIKKSDWLLVRASGRGVDVGGLDWGTISYGTVPFPWTAASRVLPGFWEVHPPRPEYGFIGTERTGTPTYITTAWSGVDRYDPNTNPTTWGNVDFRHTDKAVNGMSDGHVVTRKIRDMRDMRIWCNWATKPDWSFTNDWTN